MTDTTMIEISKGVWMPRYRLEEELARAISAGTGRMVMNPEDEEDEEDTTWPTAMGGGGLPPREAGTVAAAAAAPLTALEKAFKNYPSAAGDYSDAVWNEVPDLERPVPLVTAWYSCVKRYRLIKYGWQRLIIEVELIGGTTLRHIIKLSHVKGVLTKSNTHRCVWIGEVIIDLRKSDQLKLKFSSSENALAFHLALEDMM